MKTEKNEMSAGDQFEAVEKAKVRLQTDFLLLGEILLEIRDKKSYRAKGYKTFKDFIETEYNLSSSFAGKIMNIYELFVNQMDMDETDLTKIGFDRLALISPFVSGDDISTAEAWIEEAKKKSTPELRKSVKEEKDKAKKQKTFKEIFVDQFIERMVTFFNCNVKSLNFKMAVYFQDRDLEEIKQEIKNKQMKMEQSGEFTDMFRQGEK